MALNPDGTKTCCSCCTRKPVSEYYVYRRRTGDGFASRCIACAKAAAIAWQKSHPDQKAASDKKQRIKNAKRAEVDLAFREKRAESVRRWAKANTARLREKQREYKKKDPERCRQQNQCNNNRARASKLGLPNAFSWANWKTVIAHFNNACAFCGVTGALLDVEHLVALSNGGGNVMGNVVPACRPCNAQKYRRTLTEFCSLRGLNEAAIMSKVKRLLDLTETVESPTL